MCVHVLAFIVGVLKDRGIFIDKNQIRAAQVKKTVSHMHQ